MPVPLCPPSAGGTQHPAEAHPVAVAGPGGSQVHAAGTDEPGEGDEVGDGDRVCSLGRRITESQNHRITE